MLQRGRIDRHVNAVQTVKFPFAFDTPGLRDGITVYTPTPGDLILEGWLETVEAWDGVTPFVGGAWADPVGDLNVGSSGFWDTLLGGLPMDGAPVSVRGNAGVANGQGGRVQTNAPMRLWVSRDGTAGGPDPGATQGKAILFLALAPA